MLDGHRRYPRLLEGVRLMHPEGTDEFFVYRSAGGERYELNEVAYEMLSHMDGFHDTEVICAAICAKFEGADTVREDLEALLKDLAAEECLEYVLIEAQTAGAKEERDHAKIRKTFV